MRVNIDDKIEKDTRITFAAAQLEISRPEFIGRVIPVWMAAYRNRSAVMPRRNVDALAELRGFADAMIAEDLATVMDDEMLTVRLRGVTERIEFLEIQDSKREKANQAKRTKAGLPPACPPGPPAASAPGRPYSLTLTLTPSPSPSPDQPHEQDHARAHEKGARKARSLVHPEALRLSGELFDLNVRTIPGTKIASAPPEARERTVRRWAADVEKLNRLDGIAYEQIDATIQWLPTDDFWSDKIQSGDKLREKYDQLVAKRTRKGGNGKAPAMPADADYEALADWANGAQS